MVNRDYFKMLSEEECKKYRFGFCECCPLYECELVGEYEKFRTDHFSEEQFSKDDIRVLQAISVTASDEESKERKKYIRAEAVIKSDDKSQKKFYIDSFSYDQDELKEGCFMSQRHVIPIECGNKTVTDGIRDHYKIETDNLGKIKTDNVDRWEPLQPVFISAQTGQGKNYFIENTLLPYVRELNHRNQTDQKVLIFSNRLALQQQIKEHLGKIGSLNDEVRQVYSYGEYADVMTYQSVLYLREYLMKKQNDKDRSSRYIFVICDEAHFFTSDAMFNPHTQRILETIVKIFQDAIRIYMSATPYECLEYINQYEYQCDTEYQKKNMLLYHFKRDYDYLDVKAYSEICELYEEIVSSVNERGEKWLIFIDDKRKCQKLKKELEEFGEKNSSLQEKIFAVDASSKENQTYCKILENEKLGKDISVLISTSVLDNGINLRDIDNIVVGSMEKVKCLQMVGRARTDEKHRKKTLFIRRFAKEYVKRRIEDLEDQRDAYHKYDLAYGERATLKNDVNGYQFWEKYYNRNSRDWENAKHWFGRLISDPVKLYLNKIARSLVERMILEYKVIYDEMESEYDDVKNGMSDMDRAQMVGQNYLEYQLSWFGKMYCRDNDVTFANKGEAKKNFIDFLESYIDSGELIEEKWESFQAQFISLFDAAFYKSDKNGRNYGSQKMNNLLENQNIGYRISGKPQKGPWTVIHFKWFSD